MMVKVSLIANSGSEWREKIRDLLVSTGGIAIIFVVSFLTFIALVKCIKAIRERLNATIIEKQAIQNVAAMLKTQTAQSPLHYGHNHVWQAVKREKDHEEDFDEIKFV